MHTLSDHTVHGAGIFLNFFSSLADHATEPDFSLPQVFSRANKFPKVEIVFVNHVALKKKSLRVPTFKVKDTIMFLQLCHLCFQEKKKDEV